MPSDKWQKIKPFVKFLAIRLLGGFIIFAGFVTGIGFAWGFVVPSTEPTAERGTGSFLKNITDTVQTLQNTGEGGIVIDYFRKALATDSTMLSNLRDTQSSADSLYQKAFNLRQ